jgi:hypothetical protein
MVFSWRLQPQSRADKALTGFGVPVCMSDRRAKTSRGAERQLHIPTCYRFVLLFLNFSNFPF